MNKNGFYLLYGREADTRPKELVGHAVLTVDGLTELKKVAEELSVAGYKSFIVSLDRVFDQYKFETDYSYRERVYNKVIHTRYEDNGEDHG